MKSQNIYLLLATITTSLFITTSELHAKKKYLSKVDFKITPSSSSIIIGSIAQSQATPTQAQATAPVPISNLTTTSSEAAILTMSNGISWQISYNGSKMNLLLQNYGYTYTIAITYEANPNSSNYNTISTSFSSSNNILGTSGSSQNLFNNSIIDTLATSIAASINSAGTTIGANNNFSLLSSAITASSLIRSEMQAEKGSSFYSALFEQISPDILYRQSSEDISIFTPYLSSSHRIAILIAQIQSTSDTNLPTLMNSLSLSQIQLLQQNLSSLSSVQSFLQPLSALQISALIKSSNASIIGLIFGATTTFQLSSAVTNLATLFNTLSGDQIVALLPGLTPLQISQLPASKIQTLSSDQLTTLIPRLSTAQITLLIKLLASTPLIKILITSLSPAQVSGALSILLPGAYTGGSASTYSALINMGFTQEQIIAAYNALTDKTGVDASVGANATPQLTLTQILALTPAQIAQLTQGQANNAYLTLTLTPTTIPTNFGAITLPLSQRIIVTYNTGSAAVFYPPSSTFKNPVGATYSTIASTVDANATSTSSAISTAALLNAMKSSFKNDEIGSPIATSLASGVSSPLYTNIVQAISPNTIKKLSTNDLILIASYLSLTQREAISSTQLLTFIPTLIAIGKTYTFLTTTMGFSPAQITSAYKALANKTGADVSVKNAILTNLISSGASYATLTGQGFTKSQIVAAIGSPSTTTFNSFSSTNVTLSLNSVGVAVKQLQDFLSTKIPSLFDQYGTLGGPTIMGIKQFQASRNIFQSGSLDQVTVTAINAAIAKVNSTDTAAFNLTPISTTAFPVIDITSIKRLQNFLTHQGYFDAYGIFGTVTKKAVIEFQKKYSITATGKFDAATIKKANELLTINSVNYGIYLGSCQSTQAFSPTLSLQIGSKDPQVKNLQDFLVSINLPIINQDSSATFGTSTKQTIRDFQRTNNIPVDGIFAGLTVKKANKIIAEHTRTKTASSLAPFPTNTNLKQGSKGPQVAQLHTFLVNANNHDIPGTFGPATHAAVQIFQKHNNLAQTGIFEGATVEVANEIAAEMKI